MKRFLILLLVPALLLFCAGCAGEPEEKIPPSEGETETAEAAEFSLPQGLAGSWISVSPGDLGYTENITLYEDGTITVELLKDGETQQLIAGTFHVEGGTLYYEITEGTAPYEGSFGFRLDGRELFLDDSDGEAHYLRNS